MVNNATFREKVFAFAQRSESLGEPQVAFGLKQFDERIVASLLKAQRWARIVVVSPPGVDSRGMQTVASDNPEETLARLLATDQVEGIIRGTLDDFKTIEAYERLSNEKCTLVPALLENTMGQQFFVEPVSNPDGWDKGDRLLRGLGLAEFVMRWEIVPRIAVYAGVRRDTYERRKEDRDGVIGTLNQTYDDAEWIVDEFVKKGLEAKNWTIELDAAVRDGYNIHIPVNGMVGNQVSRGILAGGGTIVAVPRLGLSRLYEDNTRTETDFEFHVAGSANQSAQGGGVRH